VVKEFGLRICEQTKATTEAMQAAFGSDFTKQIFDGIKDGSLTVEQALQKVGKELDETKIPANQLQTVIADMFGGPGEDAGIDYLKSLKNVGKGVDELVDKTNAYTQRQSALLDSQTELAAAQNDLTKQFEGGGTVLDTLTNKAISEVVKATVEWAKTSDVAKAFLQQLSQPVRDLFSLLSNAPAYFAAFSAGADTAFGAIGRAWTKLKTGDFRGVKDEFFKLGTDVATAYNKAFDEVMLKKSIAAAKGASTEADPESPDKRAQGGDGITDADRQKAAEKAYKEAKAARDKAGQAHLDALKTWIKYLMAATCSRRSATKRPSPTKKCAASWSARGYSPTPIKRPRPSPARKPTIPSGWTPSWRSAPCTCASCKPSITSRTSRSARKSWRKSWLRWKRTRS
jgi:hypothetical protein